MSIDNELKDLLGITKAERQEKIAYLFKKGQSIKSLCLKFKLKSSEVESCIRKYMASDERFEDVEDE